MTALLLATAALAAEASQRVHGLELLPPLLLAPHAPLCCAHAKGDWDGTGRVLEARMVEVRCNGALPHLCLQVACSWREPMQGLQAGGVNSAHHQRAAAS